MDLKSTGNNILKEHKRLSDELTKIPNLRNIIYREDYKNDNKIGKPRFNPPTYNWPPDLFIRLRNHLQNIWNFFNEFSFWFDDTIKPIINFEERRISKKSVIFLLQNDLWTTDEIFGDYLIEKAENIFTISYFRRNEKRQTFVLEIELESEIENWICNDVRKQILDQFSFLWTYLQTEIETCIKEDFINLPSELLTPDYIIGQTTLIEEIIPQYPEAALLNLGRLAELCLVQLLNLKSKPKSLNLAWESKNKGLINQTQVKLFDSIRKEYNSLKHTLTYSIDKNKIENLWKKFSIFISKSK